MVDLTTKGLNVTRTQNHYYRFAVAGLRPNTKHNITIDGVDYAFATKQFGKDFGADLLSDENGELKLGVLYELRYGRDANFELPQRQTLSFQDDVLNSGSTGDRKVSKTIVKKRIIELISPDGLSYAQYVFSTNILMTAGPIRVLYPIE